MRFLIALWVGKIVRSINSIFNKDGGSNVPGNIAMRIDPNMISHFKGIDYDKVIFVSGTNGKSTTTNMLYHVLKSNNKKVIANLKGANLITGLATLLIENSTFIGNINTEYIVLETDERYFHGIRQQFPGRNLLLTNIQKDQAQRNGEPGFVMNKIRDAALLNPKLKMFLNNHEPRSKSFETFSDKTVYYQVDKNSRSFTKGSDYATMPCPKCHHKIEFKYYNNDYVGPFKCENCGYTSNPEAEYSVDYADFDKNEFTINGIKFSLPYSPPYMLYNMAAVTAAAREFAGISIEETARSMLKFQNIKGRFESLDYKGKTIKYMRFKQENPETLQTFLNEVAQDKTDKMIAIGPGAIQDEIPHFMETFYLYDCDFSELHKSDIKKILCFSKYVCYDTANRFLYEGFSPDLINVMDTNEAEDILREIDNTECETVYLGTFLHTFEEMKKYIDKEKCNG